MEADQGSWSRGEATHPVGLPADTERRGRDRHQVRRRVFGRAVVIAALAAVLAACTANSGPDSGTPTTQVTSDATADDAAQGRYISIGDSYAAGYQPSSADGGSTTTNGFAYVIGTSAAALGHPVAVLNFGCSGATSTQIVNQDGCRQSALGPGATPYPDESQAAAALSAIQADPATVDLVTIVMGGNDVQGCLFDDDPQTCIEDALPAVAANVGALTAQIRAAVGPDVPIVGLTYPDAYLAASVVGGRDGVDGTLLSTMSVELFQKYLNPALKAAYTENGAQFVDITELAGTYGDQTVTTQVDGTTAVPVPVADACRLTFYCQYKDVHPTDEGHRFIADAILKAAFDA